LIRTVCANCQLLTCEFGSKVCAQLTHLLKNARVSRKHTKVQLKTASHVKQPVTRRVATKCPAQMLHGRQASLQYSRCQHRAASGSKSCPAYKPRTSCRAADTTPQSASADAPVTAARSLSDQLSDEPQAAEQTGPSLVVSPAAQRELSNGAFCKCSTTLQSAESSNAHVNSQWIPMPCMSQR